MQSRFDFERASEAAFERYHADNPQVYEAALRFALDLKRRGRKRLGMKAVFERLRWWSNVEATAGDSLKLNNNMTAYYARRIMQQTPELAGFFETRRSKGDVR
mgnify:FL=1